MNTTIERAVSRFAHQAGPALALLLAAAPALAARHAEPQLYVPGELIVQYRSEAAATLAKAAYATEGLVVRRTLLDRRTQLLALPAFTDVEQARRLLAARPDVAVVEPNYLRKTRVATPNDTLFGEQWGLYSTGQLNFVCDTDNSPCDSRNAYASLPGADMNMPAAWDPDGDGVFDRTGSAAVVVAVIDDAFDLTHPDLAANFIAGRDLADGDNDPSPDSNGLLDHGTLVSGSLGAIGNNGEGIAGVVWNVSMMPLKVGRVRDGEVQLSTDAILDAYAYARTNGAQIINASFGGPSYSQTEFNAIQSLEQAGILFVASAGNFNSNLDDSKAAYPANYDVPNVVAVAASNRQDNVASFSQFGPISADVAAPGLQIVSTALGGGYVTGESCGSNGPCGVNGTSFSAPHVAGIAALIKAAYPNADYRELRARIIEGAEPGVDGGDAEDLTVGGRADAANSLDLAPRPSLIVRSVRLIDDGNQRLDPGESLDIEVTVENLWQSASAVQAELSAPAGVVSVSGGALSLGDVASGATTTARFTVQVTDTVARPYQNLEFAVVLSANGGAYQARRPFLLELAELGLGQAISETLSEGLHDEFHTYHIDVPTAPTPGQRLVIQSTVAEIDPATGKSKDIDLLIKYGQPPQYDIDLGADPEDDPTFFTNADQVGGGEDGNERVVIVNPRAGTYYVTIANYSLSESLGYTLEARLETKSGGGGGALSLDALLALGLMAVLSGLLPRVRRRLRVAPIRSPRPPA